MNELEKWKLIFGMMGAFITAVNGAFAIWAFFSKRQADRAAKAARDAEIEISTKIAKATQALAESHQTRVDFEVALRRKEHFKEVARIKRTILEDVDLVKSATLRKINGIKLGNYSRYLPHRDPEKAKVTKEHSETMNGILRTLKPDPLTPEELEGTYQTIIEKLQEYENRESALYVEAMREIEIIDSSFKLTYPDPRYQIKTVNSTKRL